jgi:PTH1 family peptidyl-tRNA hydrolase
MLLITGLGNPGVEYATTRHNAGFMVVEAVRQAFGLPAWSNKFKGLVSKGKIGPHDVVLLMPQTYMNLSGESVQPALAFYKLPPANLLVVHDEIDIPVGEMKYKVGGGDAGHNGLKSITKMLGSPNYARLRMGVGRPAAQRGEVVNHVLGTFGNDEFDALAANIEWLIDAMPGFLDDPQKVLSRKPKGVQPS